MKFQNNEIIIGFYSQNSKEYKSIQLLDQDNYVEPMLFIEQSYIFKKITQEDPLIINYSCIQNGKRVKRVLKGDLAKSLAVFTDKFRLPLRLKKNNIWIKSLFLMFIFPAETIFKIRKIRNFYSSIYRVSLFRAFKAPFMFSEYFALASYKQNVISRSKIFTLLYLTVFQILLLPLVLINYLYQAGCILFINSFLLWDIFDYKDGTFPLIVCQLNLTPDAVSYLNEFYREQDAFLVTRENKEGLYSSEQIKEQIY